MDRDRHHHVIVLPVEITDGHDAIIAYHRGPDAVLIDLPLAIHDLGHVGDICNQTPVDGVRQAPDTAGRVVDDHRADRFILVGLDDHAVFAIEQIIGVYLDIKIARGYQPVAGGDQQLASFKRIQPLSVPATIGRQVLCNPSRMPDLFAQGRCPGPAAAGPGNIDVRTTIQSILQLARALDIAQDIDPQLWIAPRPKVLDRAMPDRDGGSGNCLAPGSLLVAGHSHDRDADGQGQGQHRHKAQAPDQCQAC